ncbi:NAD(P)/FAD-dependent oxidoreductase [Arthrobacter monumenti]
MTGGQHGSEHHNVVIIGGGNAGISLAGRLRRYKVSDVAIVEPSEEHLYQPLLSHIAGGTADPKLAVRPQSSVIPSGIRWIQDRVVDILPVSNTVVLESGRRLSYGHLVVCPGIQKNWEAVPGLTEAMDSPYGASNYEFDLAAKAWTLLRTHTQGTVVFNQPAGAASCAGAAQKPMYLACDYWRRKGVLQDIRVVMVVPTPTIFGMPLIDQELNRKIAEYGVELHCNSELAEVDAGGRAVVVQNRVTGAREKISYDILHAVPPQSAPDWLKSTDLSPSADVDGFVDVDPETLRHNRYPNVWSLGDAAGTRNSKSGAALRKQTLVVAKNIRAVLNSRRPSAKYDSYSACPFTVSRSSVVFSEFDDEYRPKPTVPKWNAMARERRSTWVLERYILPQVYWKLILKGRA